MSEVTLKPIQYKPMPATHPDYNDYRQNPAQFMFRLYMDIKARWASIYADSQEDAQVGMQRLIDCLTSGEETRETLLHKITVMRNVSSEPRFRSACSRIVRDFFWRKQFEKNHERTPPAPQEPYSGTRFDRFPHEPTT